jgi:hypothetical protein
LIESRVDQFLKPGLEDAQCEDELADDCGRKYRPVEARRDREEPALLLNRAPIFPFISGGDALGLVATQNPL